MCFFKTNAAVLRFCARARAQFSFFRKRLLQVSFGSDFCFLAGFVGCVRARRVRNVQLVQRAGVGFFPLSLVCGGARARAAFGEGEAGWEICLSLSLSLSLYLSVCAVCACVCMYVCV